MTYLHFVQLLGKPILQTKGRSGCQAGIVMLIAHALINHRMVD
jgi:hypothetical protein